MPASNTESAAEMLPLPGVRTLTDDRLHGRACAWCGAEEPGTLRGLGPRIFANAYRTDTVFHPRGCALCVRREALRVVSIHVGVCPRCAGNGYCPAYTALQRLAQGVGL